MKGKYFRSKEYRERISRKLMGHIVPDKVRRKISISLSGRPSPMKGMKGTIPSMETRKKRSESLRKTFAQRRGFVVTEEHRKNMSIAHIFSMFFCDDKSS